uniref:glutathione gamma-glutamylcysteinyltransferase n=1 Tax=Sporobolomyces primogenomicus TaxID=2877795 RepID=A0A096ZRU9_9BASI|nr:phytochelatin synthase [Sporobolomyces primogenomicus]
MTLATKALSTSSGPASAPVHHPQARPSPPPPSLASKSFYKRPLPPTCVPFNSPRGRQLFAQALTEDHLDSYFLLSQHFLTQNEPAYCALGTLAMILNAFELDPQRVWKGPWRFYDQNMLDCCRPLADIAQVGLTLSEFACLARCNGLRASVVSPRVETLESLSRSSRQAGLEQFRHDLKKASRGQGTMAISYSRQALGQTGTGHFSPVGAYSERDDQVLILDVARFKYPSYWIPAELAFDSMIPIDDATGQPRGYVMLDVAPSPDAGSLAGRQSLTTLTLNKSSWAVVSNALSRLLLETTKSSTLESLLERILNHLSNLPTPAVTARPPPVTTMGGSADSPAPSRPSSPSPSSLDTLTSSLSASTLPDSPTNPLVPLLLLALFSPRSSLTALVPPHLSEPLRELCDSIVGSNEVVREEVEFLTGQLGALGECCRAEEEGAACGCASKKGSIEVEQKGCH